MMRYLVLLFLLAAPAFAQQSFTLDTNNSRVVGFGPRGNLEARTIVARTDPAFVWGVWSTLDNYSDSGNNVAVYGQSNARGHGPTWGMVSEVTDMAEVYGNQVGHEITMNMAGPDRYGNRIGLDVTINDARLWRGRPQQTGPVEATAGVRVNGAANYSWGDAYRGWGYRHAGIYLTSTHDESVGLTMDGSMAAVLDIQGAYYPILMRVSSLSGAFRVGQVGPQVGYLRIIIDGREFALAVHAQ